MQKLLHLFKQVGIYTVIISLAGCATGNTVQYYSANEYYNPNPHIASESDYAGRLPQQVDTDGKKMVLVDPNAHAWGAYGADGKLIRAGIATAGGATCPPDETGEPDCRTGIGTFHITSMGGGDCYSKTYPKPQGGGLMPYCMYFNNGQALHGSPDDIVLENNVSHGCVRMRIQDAEWMRNNFAQVGTKVKVLPY